MPLVERIVFGIFAQCIDISKEEVFSFGRLQHLRAILRREEFTLVVEQLQRIPLTGIMTGRDDDAAIGSGHRHGQFGGRCRSQSDVHHVETHAHERAAYDVLHHLARDASVATYNDFVAAARRMFANERGVGRREFHNVERVERIARCSADSSADAGNRFNQCHDGIVLIFFGK